MQSLFWKLTVLTGVICSSCVIVYQAHKAITQTADSTDAADFRPVEELPPGTADGLAEYETAQHSPLQSQLAPLPSDDGLGTPQPTLAPPRLVPEAPQQSTTATLPEWARLDSASSNPPHSESTTVSGSTARSFPDPEDDSSAAGPVAPNRIPAPNLWLNGNAPPQNEPDVPVSSSGRISSTASDSDPIENVNHTSMASGPSAAEGPAALFSAEQPSSPPEQSEPVESAPAADAADSVDDLFPSPPAADPRAGGPVLPADEKGATADDSLSSPSVSRTVPPIEETSPSTATAAAATGLIRLPDSHPGPVLLPTPKGPPPTEEFAEVTIRQRQGPAPQPDDRREAAGDGAEPVFPSEAPVLLTERSKPSPTDSTVGTTNSTRESSPAVSDEPGPKPLQQVETAADLFIPTAPAKPARASGVGPSPTASDAAPNVDDKDPFGGVAEAPNPASDPAESNASTNPSDARPNAPGKGRPELPDLSADSLSGDTPPSSDAAVGPSPGKSAAPEWSTEPTATALDPPGGSRRPFPGLGSGRQSGDDIQSSGPAPLPPGPTFDLVTPSPAIEQQGPASDGLPQIVPGQSRQRVSPAASSDPPQNAVVPEFPLGPVDPPGAGPGEFEMTPQTESGPMAEPAKNMDISPATPSTAVAPATSVSTSSPSTTDAEQGPSALLGTGTVDPNVPSTPQSPELRIEKNAPPKAEIGDPIIYSITIRNVGKSAAHNVVVEDRVPKGAELDGTSPRAYEIDGKLIWKLETMKPGEERTIHLRVIPREAGEIGSVATVSFSSSVSARIKVTAPQLSIVMHGPSEAVAGEELTYRFHVHNAGQGDARNVWLRAVLPPALKHPSGDDIEYEIGLIPAGASRDVELTLSAAEVGQLSPQALLTINAETKAQTRADLRIIDARLKLSRTGPQRRFVGRPAGYVTTVTNQSSKTLSNIKVTETLPKGVEPASVPLQGRWDRNRRTITWTIPQLAAGESKELQSQLVAAQAGDHAGHLAVTDDSGNRAELATTLDVKGFADLDVDVQRPRQPVAVGEQVSLRLTVTNDGTATAKNVETGFLLPPNVQFVSANGPVQPRQDGQSITFAVAEVAVGQRKTFDVVVTAAEQGDARIKVHLSSAELDAPLETEEPLRIIRDGP